MEHKLDCCVVRDLLPAYLEGLTEEETTPGQGGGPPGGVSGSAVGHREAMQASLPVVRAPKRALAFLKKVKRTRLIAARPVGSGGPAPHLSGVRQRVPLAWGPPLPHPGAPGLSGAGPIIWRAAP